MIARVAVFVMVLLMAGCGAPGNVVVLIPDETGAVGKVSVQNQGAAVALDTAFAAAAIEPRRPPTRLATGTEAQIDREFAAALSATPPAPRVFRVFFANAGADLDADALIVIDEAVAAAKGTPNLDIGIVGHADAIGHSSAENLPLSLRRAEAVGDALVARGIPASIIDIAHFGASDPQVPNKPGVPEPLNRRVEITIR